MLKAIRMSTHPIEIKDLRTDMMFLLRAVSNGFGKSSISSC
jgi:hypothetical protein